VKSIPLILILLLTNSFLSASIVVKLNSPVRISQYRFFKEGFESSRTIRQKQITPAEYATDPLLLYGILWGCFGTAYPLWETRPSFVTSADEFGSRFKMEPFATGRTEPFVKPLTDSNGSPVYDSTRTQQYVLRNDVYAKNLIEPFYFIQMSLYLRSKNYHPALLIGEIFIMSFVYEFTLRPLFMVSSFEQLIKNPAVGLIFGIILDEVSNFLLSTPFTGLHVLAYILNPFNALPVSRIHPMFFFSPYRQAATLEAVIKL
jgi:hypothetical protein